MGVWVFDTEGDSLNATKLHVLSVSNAKGTVRKSTHSYDEMRKFFLSAKAIIAHNCQRYDIPTVERILNIKISCKIVDTLPLSWALFPERGRHGLESWGEELGVKKPEITDWENLSQEEYAYRCEQDVEINRRLWNKIYNLLWELYGNDEDIWRYIDYLSFKMYCARLQEESGWKVDIEKAQYSLSLMNAEKEAKVAELKAAMPPVPIKTKRFKPKKFFKKDGSFSVLGEEWNRLLAEKALPADYNEPIEIITGYNEPNPDSPTQIKDWLYSLGWEPRTFKYVKGEDGSIREIPQINQELGKGICPSIEALYEVEPRLEVLDGLSILNHRIPLLQGILNGMDFEGKTKAQVQGLTNTLRFQHTTVVNLPKIEKPWGEDIRGSLIATEGHILCGSDMASLEDRLKQHYIFPHDPEYVHSMNREDFEPHLTIAGMAGMLTEEEILEYKQGDKRNKPIRDVAKNGNYACQYGAHPPKLTKTCGINLKQATNLFNAYWKLNWSVKAVAEEQHTKTVQGKMWLKNPLNGFYYTLRKKNDIFSTLIQGTASFVFDMWLKNILDKRPQLTGQFHDEIILNIKQGSEEKCTELLNYAIDKLNKDYKLNRELGISIQFNQKYSGIH